MRSTSSTGSTVGSPLPTDVSRPALSTPAAILVGSVVIAAALYLGLRSFAPVPVAPATSSSQSALPPIVSSVPVTWTPAALRRVVQAELERHRQPLTAACLPDGGVVRLTFNFTIAADGHQLSRGVSEERDAGSPEVTACVLERLSPLKVRPLGQKMKIDVRFVLP
jgi:hypothetical protein